MDFFHKLDNLVGWFAGAVVSVMIVHICADVIGKFMFSTPISGTIAVVVNYYMPVITFLPLAYVQRYDRHISVEVVTSLLPNNVQRHLYSWTLLAVAAMFSLMAYFAFEEAMRKMALSAFQIERGTRIPIWPGYFFPPIGYALMVALLGLQFTTYLRGHDPFGPTEAIDDVSAVGIDR